jgi:hypothetical protein
LPVHDRSAGLLQKYRGEVSRPFDPEIFDSQDITPSARSVSLSLR